MREPPPAQLTELLRRLGLDAERDLSSVEPTVRRLAGDLPQFQSVWIDALRQARLLTHFQAREIMAERGNELRVGSYVLCDIVREDGFATVCKAIEIESRDAFQLTVCRDNADRLPQLGKLAAAASRLPHLRGLVEACGQDGHRVWAASRWVEGASLADWMLHHGRFPPAVVWEVARAMAADLATLESAGLVHGDLRIDTVLLVADGGICHPQPGLRGIVRPSEGVAHTGLAPDACGTLSPERVAAGRPPTVASDLFACGCVWWQMLCGRPPLGGGNTLSRLRAAQHCAIDDLRQWASDVPPPLGDAITACLQKDARKRPASIAELAEQLGPSRRAGRQTIAACLQAAAQPRAPWLAARRKRARKQRPHLWTAATLAVMALIGVAWPLWVAANRPHSRSSAPSNVEAVVRNRSLPKTATIAATEDDAKGRVRSDNAVVQAGFSEPSASLQPDYELIETGLIISIKPDSMIPAADLRLRPGMTVRSARGRARIASPPEGLAVLANRVTFENIDFLPAETSVRSADREPATSSLVRVESPECAFVGCSFQSAAGSPELSVGINWNDAVGVPQAAAALPSSRIRLKDCVFRRLAAGLVLDARGANVLEVVNSLCLGPGPMLRVTRCPAADESLRISLAQFTLRETAALVDCRWRDGSEAPGEITVAATDTALAPREGAALFVLSSDDSYERLIKEMKWSGQGSVLAPRAAFARWDRRGQAAQAVDDAAISISGLVRGKIEFSGPAEGNPQASRILDCQAPLADADALGANPAVLPPDVDRAGGNRP